MVEKPGCQAPLSLLWELHPDAPFVMLFLHAFIHSLTHSLIHSFSKSIWDFGLLLHAGNILLAGNVEEKEFLK